MKLAPTRGTPHEIDCPQSLYRENKNRYPYLLAKAERWLEMNTTAPWWVRPVAPGFRVGFESTRDAALFKVFWT